MFLSCSKKNCKWECEDGVFGVEEDAHLGEGKESDKNGARK